MRFEATPQVWGISGNLGGGKTLTAVSFAVVALRRRWMVCTNVHLDVSRLSADLRFDVSSLVRTLDDLDEVDWLSLPAGSPRGSGGRKRVVVVLDEVAEWFDQFSAMSAPVKRFCSWLRHTSKRGQDVFLIVQRQEYLAKALRILCTRWVWCEDLAVWRVPVVKIHLPFCAHLVMRAYYDKNKQPIAPIDTVRKSDYGRYYNTAQNLAGGDVYEYDAPPPPPPVPRWWYVCLAVECALLLLVVC